MDTKAIKKKIEGSAGFYKDSFLNFDYQLAEFNFRSLQPYFKGDLALELGPAVGQMTKKLLPEFKKLHILEGSKELLDGIPSHNNLVKHHALFEEFEPADKYDTIVMGHVLEHIKDPVEVCKRIRTWLKKDGVLLVSVPNALSIHRLAAKEMGMLSSEYELNARDHELGHYRVYDMDLLQGDLKNAGFTIHDSGGVFFKPVSNGQIEANWGPEMIEGFFQLGKQFPRNCADIFVVCRV